MRKALFIMLLILAISPLNFISCGEEQAASLKFGIPPVNVLSQAQSSSCNIASGYVPNNADVDVVVTANAGADTTIETFQWDSVASVYSGR